MLDMQNISLSFGGVKALTDISFNVREHEIRAIIGPNGAGKSSMLNVINGVYTPQQGGICLLYTSPPTTASSAARTWKRPWTPRASSRWPSRSSTSRTST